MFKKTLTFVAATAITTGAAHASKARMTALGQSSGIGSYYLEDSRNIFHNPASLAGMNNYVIAEWNDNATGSSSDGEGGYFRGSDTFAYGFYFGADIDQRTQNTARTSNSYTKSDDMLDIFFAGEAGMDWGVRLNYGKNKVTSGTNTAYGIGFGMDMGALEAFANLDISNESTTAGSTNKMEGDFGYNVGLTYDMMGWTGWLAYNSYGYDIKTTSTTSREVMKIELGAGRSHEVSSTSRVITDVSYFYQDQEDKTTTTTTTKTRGLNVNVGFEADATSWLAWRGAFKQDLTSEIFGSTETAATTINAGATLNFGKLKVDGTIGHSSGKVGSNDFLAQVGVHYWF